MKAHFRIAAILLCMLPVYGGAQLRTVHALHNTGPDGFSTSIQPKAIHHRQGYLAVAEDRDAGGAGYDICVMWGDTCRGYNAKSRWYRTASNNDDGSYACRMDGTGDVWVAGTSTGTGFGLEDAVLLRVDTATNLPIVFAKAFGGTGSDAFFDITLTNDGGALLMGSTSSFGATSSDGYVVKVDANGNHQWSRVLGGSSTDLFMDAVQTSDGGYLLIGTTFSFTSIMSLWLVKLNSAGNLSFSRVVNNPSARWSVGYSLFQTADGGFILGGAEVNGTVSPNDADGMLMKLDAALSVQWTKFYGGPGWDDLVDFTPTDDNGDQIKDDGYLAVGYNANLSATDDYWMLKTDASGNLQWSRGWDEGNSGNGLVSVEQISSAAGYFMVGTDDKYASNSDMLALRTKPDGSGNFSCGIPTITPRVLSGTRTLTAVNPPIATQTANANATFSTYSLNTSIAVCCCDNWPNNCNAGVLDASDGLSMQLAARSGYVDVDWAFESELVNGYEIWVGGAPGELQLAYDFGAEVHSLSDPIREHGLRYYEVRAMDVNGGQLASEIRSIVLGDGQSMWLESNAVAAGEPLKLHFAGEPGMQQAWEVVDMGGRRISAGTLILDGNGQAVEWLHTMAWSAGIYVVRGSGQALRALVR